MSLGDNRNRVEIGRGRYRNEGTVRTGVRNLRKLSPELTSVREQCTVTCVCARDSVRVRLCAKARYASVRKPGNTN